MSVKDKIKVEVEENSKNELMDIAYLSTGWNWGHLH